MKKVKQTKRIISILTVFALITAVVPNMTSGVDSYVDDTYETVRIGDWEFNIRIVHYPDYLIGASISGYYGNETDLVIPGIDELKKKYEYLSSYSVGSFRGIENTTSLYIPDGVTSLGGYGAFEDCAKLESVRLPNSIDRINYRTFAKSGLKSINIPSNVEYIASWAFQDCVNLETITLNDGLMTIGSTLKGYEDVFSGCVSLKTITIPDTVETIGNRAFADCTSLENITFGNNIEVVGKNVFEGTPWLKNQPDGMLYLGGAACVWVGSTDDVKHITLKDGTTSIGNDALTRLRNLETITLPSSVENILTSTNLDDISVFENCTKLSDIIVADDNPHFTSVDGVLFKDKTTLFQYPIGNPRTSYSVPDGVTKIWHKSFYGNTTLETIIFPESVKELGDYVFSESTKLESAVFSSKKPPELESSSFYYYDSHVAHAVNPKVKIYVPYGSGDFYRVDTTLKGNEIIELCYCGDFYCDYNCDPLVQKCDDCGFIKKNCRCGYVPIDYVVKKVLAEPIEISNTLRSLSRGENFFMEENIHESHWNMVIDIHGYYNGKTGEFFTPSEYEKAEIPTLKYNEKDRPGLKLVESGIKSAYVNDDDEFVVPFGTYTNSEKFIDGFAIAGIRYYGSDYYVVIDTNGDTVIGGGYSEIVYMGNEDGVYYFWCGNKTRYSHSANIWNIITVSSNTDTATTTTATSDSAVNPPNTGATLGIVLMLAIVAVLAVSSRRTVDN